MFIKYCFFSDFLKIFWTRAFLCFPSVSVCVHTPGRQKTSAAAELAEFRLLKKLDNIFTNSFSLKINQFLHVAPGDPTMLYNIGDLLEIPADLAPGDYVLSWRFVIHDLLSICVYTAEASKQKFSLRECTGKLAKIATSQN